MPVGLDKADSRVPRTSTMFTTPTTSPVRASSEALSRWRALNGEIAGLFLELLAAQEEGFPP